MFIARFFQKLTTVQLFVFVTLFFALLSEVTVGGMGLLLMGTIPYDYMLTGLLVSLCVAVFVALALTLFLNQQKTSALRVEEQSEELSAVNTLLLQDQRLLDDIINSLAGIFYMLDDQGYLVRWNHNFEKVTGYTPEELGHMHALDFFEGEDRVLVAETNEHILAKAESSVEASLITKNGEHIPYCFTGRRMPIGTKLHLTGVGIDISERRKAEELIRNQANFDLLTKLPNRYMFHDRLVQEMKKSHRANLPMALLFIDLDRFKEVNDTLGHHAGDMLLTEAAHRITGCVRETDTVGRLGGDEFTVILGELDDPGSVDRIAQHILKKLAEPFKLGHEMAYVSASIGITLYPGDADTMDALLKNADQAMYAAKNQGRNRSSYFTASMQAAAQAKMRMANDLRHALAENQLLMYYQPIVELASGTIHKAEALLRWQHPTRGLVSPTEFIPIAEETGLIVDIGNWVFREAASQARKWRGHHDMMFQISINSSPIQFYGGNGSRAMWMDHLASLRLSGQSIAVEITEGILMEDSDDIRNKLIAFRDLGIQVSLDDFGTGYSSLSYLKKFDIDYLKIDQSFVRNLEPDSDDLALCEAIIVMAHKLGLKVVAEGIETEQQRNLLTVAGCDYGQGYYFSRPVPASEFEELLAMPVF